MPRQGQTTVKLSLEEIDILVDALKSSAPTDFSVRQNSRRLIKRLERALDRVDTPPDPDQFGFS